MTQNLNENIVIAIDKDEYRYIYFTNTNITENELTFTISKADGSDKQEIYMDVCGWRYVTNKEGDDISNQYRNKHCINYPGLFSSYTISGPYHNIINNADGFKITTTINNTLYEFKSGINPFGNITSNQQQNIGQGENVTFWNGTSNDIKFKTLYDELNDNFVTLYNIFNYDPTYILALTNTTSSQQTFKLMTSTYDTDTTRYTVNIEINSMGWGYVTLYDITLGPRTDIIFSGEGIRIFNTNFIDTLVYNSVHTTLKVISDNKVFLYYDPFGKLKSTGHQQRIGCCDINTLEWDGTSNKIDFSCVICLVSTSLIRITKDNKYKEIQYLKRGDKIYTSKGYLPISRISKQPITTDTKLICIPKDSFDIGIPFKDVISNEHHIFIINGERLTAKALLNRGKAFEINNEGKYDILYNLQFDEEVSFIVQGIISESVSPYYKHFYLPKTLYFDVRKYKDIGYVENDTWRAMIGRDKPLISE